jgi:hypothetical protein
VRHLAVGGQLAKEHTDGAVSVGHHEAPGGKVRALLAPQSLGCLGLADSKWPLDPRRVDRPHRHPGLDDGDEQRILQKAL